MDERVEIELFFGGVIAGMLLIGAEVAFFAYRTVVGAFTQTGQSIVAAGASPLTAMPIIVLLVLIVQVVQNFLIGLFFPEEVSFGFMMGDLIILVLLGSALWQSMPLAVLGIVIALFMVLVGFEVQSAEKHRHSKK
jgi:hypothetical protein